jgi:hypothetical protein
MKTSLSRLSLQIGNNQPFHRPGHRHVHQPSLFLQVHDHLFERVHMRQDSLIETRHYDALEFQSLCLMDGREIYLSPQRRFVDPLRLIKQLAPDLDVVEKEVCCYYRVEQSKLLKSALNLV